MDHHVEKAAGRTGGYVLCGADRQLPDIRAERENDYTPWLLHPPGDTGVKGLRLAVIAGTSEATDLIAVLPEQDCVTAFAATEYGKTILEGQHCTVRVGRLDADGFRFALRGMDAVIDASHPFAQVVTETVRQVCAELELPYFRLGRQKMTYDYSRVIPGGKQGTGGGLSCGNSRKYPADYRGEYAFLL